ncbi:MAG: hypothetical protein HY926_05030 [Elusimicrobia bacterium]|nr:hypothetical protein [Elusimicrobiota bacterium]
MRAAAIAVMLLLAQDAAALQKEVGTSAAEFLRLGAGARSLGMGEASTAVAAGPEAVYWNPAGLARLARPEAAYSRTELPVGMHQDYGAVAVPVRLLRGTLAFAMTRFSQDGIDMVDANNRARGSFAPHSEVYALAYGHQFAGGDPVEDSRDFFGETWNVPNMARPLGYENEPWTGEISAGLSFKMIDESLGPRHAAAVAVDAGGLFRPVDLHDLTLAGAVRHLGGLQRFINESAPLPVEFAAAAAYEFRLERAWRFLPVLEADVPYAGNPYGKLGVEVEHVAAEAVLAALRLGYCGRTAPDLGPLSGLTAGVGLQVRRFSFDAGFQPMGALGQSFRLGVGWKF